ncbi:zinc-binding dehydrogenase [bacterium]|jgi:NADPH:quinone reductase-like Zn-dependent oxidoreductase/predicted dehydrogenase|nr:zinc-binding dehydrogenase [bacterium]MBT5015692.1 zinc-binding dehydrogenase [bacterium]
MRQVFLNKEALSIKEVCQPLLDDYSVLVSVTYSFMSTGKGLANVLQSNQQHYSGGIPEKIRHLVHLISHQDTGPAKNIIKDSGSYIPLGQSCSGVIIAIGKKVQKFRIGDYVACTGDGLANHADVVCIPEKLAVRIEDENFLKEACITGIGAMALQSVRRASIELGDFVAIVGLETLGQLMVQLAKLSGARVIAFDTEPTRLELARKSGAEHVFNLNDKDFSQTIKSLTSSHGLDRVIISPDCFCDNIDELFLDLTRKKGTIVVAGNKKAKFNQESSYQKEINVLFSFSHGPGRYEQDYEYGGYDYPYAFVRWSENRNLQLFANMIVQKQLRLEHLLEKEVQLSELTNLLDQRNNDGIGFVLDYDKKDEKDSGACPVQLLKKNLDSGSFIPARYDRKVKVSFYGLNGVTQNGILPTMAGLKDFAIDRIVDRNISHALNTANKYRGAVPLTGGLEILRDIDQTDAIFFGSLKGVSLENFMTILEQQKSLFITHPLAKKESDIRAIEDFFEKSPESKLFICFNRTYSPFIKKIKTQIDQRSVKPMMMNYRVNLKAVDRVQKKSDQEGSIIARASHIIDVLCYLNDSKPVSISVEALSPRVNHIFPTDNFSCQISFANGSVCSILFTALGYEDSGNERLEIFYDSKTIVMEDYVRLTGFGLPQTFDELVREPDMGYGKMLEEYLKYMNLPKQDLLSSIVRWNTVQSLTLAVDELACQGGGEKTV